MLEHIESVSRCFRRRCKPDAAECALGAEVRLPFGECIPPWQGRLAELSVTHLGRPRIADEAQRRRVRRPGVFHTGGTVFCPASCARFSSA